MNPIRQKIIQAKVDAWLNHIGHNIQFKDGSIGELAQLHLEDETLYVRLEGDRHPNFKLDDIYLCECQRSAKEKEMEKKHGSRTLFQKFLSLFSRKKS